ncbi:hypothetical protein [Aestuariimicrobium sp. Y1814]|uniref:hypothetical protein n=1 Tax=Aestuariimicrobium sp. Y1814 TaxID=3418742 RepID=UPI003DA7089B
MTVFTPEQADVSGTQCLPGLQHSTFGEGGQGITLPCDSNASLLVEQPFAVADVPADKLAAALQAVFSEIPRDTIQYVDVRSTAEGIRLFVTAEGTNGTWTLDGARV